MMDRFKRLRDRLLTRWTNWEYHGWDDDDDWDDFDKELTPQMKVTESDLKPEFSLVDNKDKFGPRLKIKLSDTFSIIMNRQAIDSHVKELQKYRALLDKMADDTPKDELDADIINMEGEQ